MLCEHTGCECILKARSHTPMFMLPLWDVNSHPEHLLLEALLVVTESTSEEEEAGAVGLTLTHKQQKIKCGAAQCTCKLTRKYISFLSKHV